MSVTLSKTPQRVVLTKPVRARQLRPTEQPMTIKDENGRTSIAQVALFCETEPLMWFPKPGVNMQPNGKHDGGTQRGVCMTPLPLQRVGKHAYGAVVYRAMRVVKAEDSITGKAELIPGSPRINPIDYWNDRMRTYPEWTVPTVPLPCTD